MRFSTGAALFQVDLSVLKQHGFRVDRPAAAEELGISGEDATLGSPLSAHLGLDLKGSRIKVEGEIKGLVLAPCRRCLETLKLNVAAPVDLTYRFEGLLPRSRYEDEEDVEVDSDEGPDEDGLVRVLETHDLAPGLRDCFLLAIPERPLCREECKGLCPRCGTNLNLASCGCGERT